jgi:hypothetical protein
MYLKKIRHNRGVGTSAEKMKECVWLRPEAVAQIEFLEWRQEIGCGIL